MFYEDGPYNNLRFGDVVRGFVIATPNMDEPHLRDDLRDYTIEIDTPRFSVVLSPCCQIKQKTILLTPLVEIYAKFLQNPYYAEDLTRINRKMTAEQSLSPGEWQSLDDNMRAKRTAEGMAYALVNHFIYAPHSALPTYDISMRGGGVGTVGHYMIDFGSAYRLKCENVNSPTDSPVESKITQLSIQTRDELRKKLSSYYSRLPEEDRVALQY